MDLQEVLTFVLYLYHKHEDRLHAILSDQHQEMAMCFEKLAISPQVGSAKKDGLIRSD